MVVRTTCPPAKRPAGRKSLPTAQAAPTDNRTEGTTTAATEKKAGKKAGDVQKKSAAGRSSRAPRKVPTRKVTACAVDAVADEDDEAARDAIAFAQRRFVKHPDSIIKRIVHHKRSAVERLDDPPPAPLPTLLSRVSRAIERELTHIEIIVGGVRVNPSQRTEAERRARTLASLARTLREVMHLRASEENTRQDDDALPRDIDQLRDQLARRLDQLVAEAKAAHPGEAE